MALYGYLFFYRYLFRILQFINLKQRLVFHPIGANDKLLMSGDKIRFFKMIFCRGFIIVKPFFSERGLHKTFDVLS